MSDNDTGKKFNELLEVMAQLRGDNGCPWDKEQTHASLKPCLLEETYELLDALNDGDPHKLRDELGDVLLQVVFHAQIAREAGTFTAKDVIHQLTEKLIRRHPHVFAGGPLLETTDSVLKQRLRIKASEKSRGTAESALGSVPRAMPALARSQRITERASKLGFDWPSIDPVWKKVEEEMQELKAAAKSGDRTRVGEELGDLLFSLVNLSRFLELQAEEVLTDAIDRFTRRFRHIENRLKATKRSFDEVTLEEMDRLWEEAKERERQGTASE